MAIPSADAGPDDRRRPDSGSEGPQWFSFRYGLWKPLLAVLGGGPARSSVVVDRRQVAVKMGRLFDGRAPVAAVSGASQVDDRVISRGVHGWAGDWLVNGAGDGLVEVRFEPPMRAHVFVVPVRVRRLRVSVDDPAGLADALRRVAHG